MLFLYISQWSHTKGLGMAGGGRIRSFVLTLATVSKHDIVILEHVKGSDICRIRNQNTIIGVFFRTIESHSLCHPHG